jgi:hypothetical protein
MYSRVHTILKSWEGLENNNKYEDYYINTYLTVMADLSHLLKNLQPTKTMVYSLPPPPRRETPLKM